jgi:5-methylcytosine-specific restriction enzyme A
MVRSLPPRINRAPAARVAVTTAAQRPEGPPVRRYGQGRGGRPWRRRRARILARDGYLCRLCERRGILTLATEVDHILPLFLGGTEDDENLQSLCETCHAEKSEAELRDALAGGTATMTPGSIPAPMRPLWVVVGPPGAGKSTFVRDSARPGDLVIDLDDLSRQVYRRELWALSREQRAGLLVHRTELLRAFCGGETDHGQAWLIIGVPGEHHRQHWARLGGRVIVMATAHDVCRARVLERDGLPEDVRAELLATIDRWE